jgi:hypothetical protein
VSDSLVLSNTIELLGGGVPSTVPMCAGASFRLGNQYNFGTPQPVIDFVATLLGDGERPYGWRYSNRTFTLPVTITVPVSGNSIADRLTLAGGRELLQQVISAESFNLVWSPDGLLGTRDTIFECWRAAATTISYNYSLEKQLVCEMVVTFDALPFGRSDVEATLNFDSPVTGAAVPPAQVELDNYTVVGSSTQPTWWFPSVQSAYGNASAFWNHSITDFNSPAFYTRAITDSQSQGFETGVGNWATGNNDSVAQTAAQAHGGTKSLQVTSLAAGDMDARSCSFGAVTTQGMTCAPGDTINVSAWFRAAVSARSVQVGVEFFTSAGASISFAYGTSVSDSTSAFVNATGAITAPANAAFCRTRCNILATGAVNEVHYVDDVSMNRGTAVDLTGLSKLTMWLGLGADSSAAWRRWHKGPVNFTFTLTDSSARTITFSQRVDCTASDNPNLPRWNLVSVHIPQGKTFTYTSVVGYSIRVYSETHNWTGKTQAESPATYLAGLLASPEVSPRRAASTRGGTYVLYDVQGTAPSPLNIHAQLSPQPQVANTITYVLPGTPGSTQQFMAPPENPNALSGDSSNFDLGTTGSWVGGSDGLVANGTITFSNTLSNSAPNSLRVTPITGGTNVTVGSCSTASISSSGLPCAAGDRISLRLFARAGSTVRNITVAAEFFNSTPSSLGAQSLTAVADTSGGFTQYAGLVTAPANSTRCRLLITIATPAASEFHYFDDIYLGWAVQATVVCQASGGAGGSTRPVNAAGGGGGGGEIAWETHLDLNPGSNHAYSIGNGGDLFRGVGNGGNGGNSFFVGKSVTVTAHGGLGGQNEWTTDYVNGSGGNGGSGSTNAHHLNGGNGASGGQANSEAGGGGGSAGDGGAGGNGSTPAGGWAGVAGALGIRGAGGGSGMIIGTNNIPGGNPGGGGGGAVSGSTYNRDGAGGGDGKITLTITTYANASAFPSLIIHKPSPKNTVLAQPVIDVGAGNDPPDGTHEYIPTAVTPGQPARFAGTYTMLLANFSWNGSAARNVSVTVRQYESAGGAVSSTTLTQSITPANVVNGLVNMGEITLPVKDMAADNIDSYFTFAPNSANTSDRFMDLLLLDTQGQLFWLALPGSGYSDYWIDSPELTADVGNVLGSVQNRAQAVSVLGSTFMTGGPLRLVPGDNLLMVYSPSGMPALEAQYFPRYWSERLV